MMIRVNAIAPGHIRTRHRRPWENPGVPKDVWAEYRSLVERARAMHVETLQPWPRAGKPEDIVKKSDSYTARFLKEKLGK